MDTPEPTEAEGEEKPYTPIEPAEFKLRTPTVWGKTEISTLTLRATPRGMKDLVVTLDPATGKLDFKPYDLARVGLRMAGLEPSIVDKLDNRDVFDLAQVVLGFFG